MTTTAIRPPISLLEGPQTFQVFPDSKGAEGYAEILHGTLEEHHTTLHDLNDQGRGIFFTVNQSDGQGRKAANIVRVRSYICDIDDTPGVQDKFHRLRELTRSETPPSAIIESRNGLHVYWYAKDDQSTDPHAYSRVNQHLIARFRGCTQSKDVARVLRVPGFMHRKDIDNPFLVKPIFENPERRYSAEDLMRAYPLPEKPKPEITFDLRSDRKSSWNHEPDEEESARIWQDVLDGLAAWSPIDGSKHGVLLVGFGVARKFGVPQSQAEMDLTPIVARWPINESVEQSIMKHATWAYSSDAEPAHIAGLRTLGVDIKIRNNPRRHRK